MEGNEEEQQLFGHKHTEECDFKLVGSELSKGGNYLKIDLQRQQPWQPFRLIVSPANALLGRTPAFNFSLIRVSSTTICSLVLKQMELRHESVQTTGLLYESDLMTSLTIWFH